MNLKEETREKEDCRLKAYERVEAAIAAIASGGMVIMTDDEDRENEGDLVFAAEDVTPLKINFMAQQARGLICLSLTEKDVERLRLPMMSAASHHHGAMNTAFTMSIEAKNGVSTGISAQDRAHTIRVAIDPQSTDSDIVVPGHIFPVRARPGGVLERVGHTEGSVDLVRLAGKKPSAVICEIMNDDGSMARRPDLEIFASRHKIPIVSIADLVHYRLTQDTLIEEIASSPFKTAAGTFQSVRFRSLLDQSVHFALIKGDFLPGSLVDVRVIRQRPVLDVFAADEDSQIPYVMDLLKRKSHVAVVYLTSSSLDVETSYHPMDSRTYGLGAQILKKLGVEKMRLHVSTERTLKGLGGFGLDIQETIII